MNIFSKEITNHSTTTTNNIRRATHLKAIITKPTTTTTTVSNYGEENKEEKRLSNQTKYVKIFWKLCDTMIVDYEILSLSKPMRLCVDRFTHDMLYSFELDERCSSLIYDSNTTDKKATTKRWSFYFSHYLLMLICTRIVPDWLGHLPKYHTSEIISQRIECFI